VPLLYGNYALKNGVGTFSLEPPPYLNVGAGFPMVRGEEVRSVMREQLEIKRRRLASKLPPGSEAASAGQLVRLDGEIAPVVKAEAVTPASVQPAVAANAASAKEDVATPAVVLPVKGAAVETQVVASNTPPSSKAASVPATSTAVPNSKAAKTASAATAVTNATNTNSAVISGAPTTPGANAAAMVPPVAQASAKPAPKPENVTGKNESAVAKVEAKPEPSIVKAEAVVPTKPVKMDPAQAFAKATPKAAAPPLAPTAAGAAAPPVVIPKAVAPVAAVPVEPKPFVAAAPTAVPMGPTGSWKTYSSGQQPGGRVVSTEQATTLAGRNDSGRLYLRGQFVVTATGNNRAVLRQAKIDDHAPPARVIVEYPAGAVPPTQGSSIARDDGRGFEIREVRKSPDGQINIFVREVNAP
jgi:hypothetical protein